MNTIPELRGRIAAIKEKIIALADGPCSHAEVRERIAAWCQLQQAEGDRLIGFRVGGVALGGSLNGLFELTSFGAGAQVNLGPLLIGFVGADAAAQLLGRHVTATEDGPTEAERAQGLEDLKSQLFELELEEEKIIEASERDGIPIRRRPDADPAAVLHVADDEPPASRRGTSIVVAKHAPATIARRVARSAALGGGRDE